MRTDNSRKRIAKQICYHESWVASHYETMSSNAHTDLISELQTRDRDHLPTPRIEHPLLETRLAKFYPETFDMTGDEIFQQVQQLCDNIFPESIHHTTVNRVPLRKTQASVCFSG